MGSEFPSDRSPVESDHRLPILATFAVTRKRFIHPVLDAEEIRKWSLQPALGDRGRERVIVRRIGEGHVESLIAETVEKLQRVDVVKHRLRACPELLDIGGDRLEALRVALDEMRLLRTAGEGF